jgi:hypothetical protein
VLELVLKKISTGRHFLVRVTSPGSVGVNPAHLCDNGDLYIDHSRTADLLPLFPRLRPTTQRAILWAYQNRQNHLPAYWTRVKLVSDLGELELVPDFDPADPANDPAPGELEASLFS